MRKFLRIVLVVLPVFPVILLVAVFWPSPSDETLIKRWQEHRPQLEALRLMMGQDTQLMTFANDWLETVGRLPVDTSHSMQLMPPGTGLDMARSHQYWHLLAAAKVLAVSRDAGTGQPICMLAWASGFGGDTVHAEYCWLAQGPGQLGSVSGSPQAGQVNANGRVRRYRQLDPRWFLLRDDHA